jgi:hypothetical protein
MPVERIGDQGGLDSGLQRALGFNFCLAHLVSTEAGKPFMSRGHVRLRKLGESLIERAPCAGVGTAPAQGYRGLPCRESGH